MVSRRLAIFATSSSVAGVVFGSSLSAWVRLSSLRGSSLRGSSLRGSIVRGSICDSAACRGDLVYASVALGLSRCATLEYLRVRYVFGSSALTQFRPLIVASPVCCVAKLDLQHTGMLDSPVGHS